MTGVMTAGGTWSLAVTVFWAAILATPVEAPAAPLSPEKLAKIVLPATVTVVVRDAQGNPVSSGSGFFVSKDLVATNLHVIEGASEVVVETSDGRSMRAESAKTDVAHDLAVLRVPKARQKARLKLGDGDAIAVGAAVLAAGSPLGMSGTVSTGIISARREWDGATVLQTTASISRGSSGGPLVDSRGRVVGINSFYVSGGQNINFAQLSENLAALLEKPEFDFEFNGRALATGGGGTADEDTWALLSLLAQPHFAGPELEERLIGPAAFELLDVRNRTGYFSLSRRDAGSPEALRAIASRFTANPAGVQIAQASGMRLSLNGYALQRSDDKYELFATPASNVRFRVGDGLIFAYKAADFVIDAGEITSYMKNYSIHGGRMAWQAGDYEVLTDSERIGNWYATVSKAGEPALERLARKLASDSSSGNGIQAMISLIAEEIDNEPMPAQALVFKSAASALMTRAADRAGKAVLLASMLEQIDYPYLIAHGRGGPWIAVEQRDLGDVGVRFDWRGRSWLIVELTESSFRVGSDLPRTVTGAEDIVLLQDPAQGARVFDREQGSLAVLR